MMRKNTKTALGVKELWGEKGFTTNERTGIRPTIGDQWHLGWLYRRRRHDRIAI